MTRLLRMHYHDPVGIADFAIGCFYDTALHEARELSGEAPPEEGMARIGGFDREAPSGSRMDAAAGGTS